MDEFSIEGNTVDAASLQEEVTRRVEERRRAGVYAHQVESQLAERLPDEDDSGGLPPGPALDYAATRALSTWEVTAAYPVDTDKRLFRPLVILVKRMARLWARIAVGPIQREQTAFNRHVAGALEALRRQAIDERARAGAAEEDLCRLAEALTGDQDARAVTSAVIEGLGAVGRVTVLGPCPRGIIEALKENGRDVLEVSPGSSWDDRPAGGVCLTRTGPISFLGQIDEGSCEAILLCDLAFWLRPEALIDLTRRSYLALAAGALMAVAVQQYTLGAPAPAWCTPPVVEKALALAGFTDISVGGESNQSFVTIARKR